MAVGRPDKITIVVIAILAIYLMYFFLVLLNMYNTFQDISDLGLYSYNIYFYLHYPGNVGSAFQFLVFQNHISPDSLLILAPLYDVFPTPVILIFLQAVFFALTAFVVYWSIKEFTGDNAIALAIFVVFLLSPDVLGNLTYGAHVEFFIPFFYVLTFYYLMKTNTRLFFISLLLLLGSMEIAPIIAFFLFVGILVYATRYRKKEGRTQLIELAKKGAVISVMAFVLYAIINFVLTSGYNTAQYSNLPSTLYATAGSQSAIVPNIQKFISNPVAFSKSSIVFYFNNKSIGATLISLFLLFVPLGYFALFDLDVALVVLLPWIGFLFLFQTINYLQPWYEGPSLVMGSILVAAILGFFNFKKAPPPTLRKRGTTLTITIVMVVISIYLVILSPILLANKNLGNPAQTFLLLENATQRAYDSQLYSVIAKIPSNASIMAQFFIMPHLTNREFLEITYAPYYFKPAYIIYDYNLNVSAAQFPYEYNFTRNYTLTNKYCIYAQNGTATLLKQFDGKCAPISLPVWNLTR